jgi:iron complex transport system substrate-binding protein
MLFKDDLGNQFNFEYAPRRIVSLVPSQTELLCDLGLEDAVVGVTKFCVHPVYLRKLKKVVGGTKKVHFERIRLLNPDIIICNKEENTLEMVTELQQIAPVWVTDIVVIEDVFRMIELFGALFNQRVRAQQLIDKISVERANFKAFTANLPTLKVAYFIWANPYMVAGHHTFINTLLAECKFENIYDNEDKFPSRYPEVQLKKIRLDGDPDVVLLSSEPYPFKDENAFEIGRFTHHAKAIFVDGELFSWYGSRLHKAYAYFRKLRQSL